MNESVVKIVGVIILAICVICIIVSIKASQRTIAKISAVIASLTTIVSLIPYFWSVPVGDKKEVTLYYGNIEEINEMQRTYTDIVDQNYEFKKTISDQNETIDSLKKQIKDLSTNKGEAQSSVVESDGIKFEDITEILYSGVQYEKFDRTSNEKFSVAGKEHSVGFYIQNDGGIFNIEEPGYVLFNLEEKYSKMICNVGRMNSGAGVETLRITSSDGVVDMKYDVRSDASSQVLEIPLNYARDLKIGIDTASGVRYGFFDIIFYE